ncbi:hypothetical protein BDZ45DRAFT_690722 [Acephala macrosclerotiorum]|nr:hypothetical protein BDZ45DRAFT_690722 [Acephala macrosclerotiorum]
MQYDHACARIRRLDLAQSVGVDEERNQSTTFDIDYMYDSDEMHRRYPFLSPMRAEDSPAWKNIYHITNLDGSTVATRDSSPERRGPESNGDGAQTSQEEPSYTDENSMQILYPWLVEDFSMAAKSASEHRSCRGSCDYWHDAPLSNEYCDG